MITLCLFVCHYINKHNVVTMFIFLELGHTPVLYERIIFTAGANYYDHFLISFLNNFKLDNV